jgi:hypothetical protein
VALPSRSGGDCGSWLLPDGVAATCSLSLEPGWVSPSYGIKVATTVLVWKGTAKAPLDASYLFAESRLTPDERRSAGADLQRLAGC